MAAIVIFCMLLIMLPTAVAASEFTDMPDNWSEKALENAVNNCLLQGDNGKIMPNDYLTRAQMAAVVNRSFGTSEKASLSKYSDVAAGAWYYNDMAMAVHMKTFEGTGGRLNPEADITREEAFVVLARAFKLSGAPESALDKYSDKSLISNWAKDGVASLVAAGYITGYNGKLDPKQYITRAQFAQIMDNLIKNYIRSSGTYSTDFVGNVMITVPDAILKDITITGDLIIGDGVGDGDITLDSVVVTGRTVIRGGGVDSIKITGTSNLQNIVIARVDGQVRVYSEDGTEIGEVIVDGNDDVIIEGNAGNVTINASDITVTANNAEILSAIVNGENSTIIVGSNSSIDSVRVGAENVTITASKGSEIEDIIVNSNGANINGEGDVGTVAANANNVNVTTPGTLVVAGEGTSGVFAGTTAVDAGSSKRVGGRSTGRVSSGNTGGSRDDGDSNSDKAPPVFADTYPKASNITANSFDILLKADEAARYYYIMYEHDSSRSDPGVSNVRYGTDWDDSPTNTWWGNTGLIGKNEEASKSFTNMDGSTIYDIFIIAVDGSNNMSKNVVELSVTTEPDTISPNFIVEYPKVSNITANSFRVLVMADEAFTYHYIAYEQDSSRSDPNAAQVIAGTDGDGNGLINRMGNGGPIAGNKEIDLNFNNLDGLTTYNAFIIAVDGSGNCSEVAKVTVTTEQDTVTPVFADTYPKASNIAVNSFDILIKANEAATYHCIAYEHDSSRADPNAAQVIAGTDGDGSDSDVMDGGNLTIPGNTEKAFEFESLDEATDYDVFIVAADGSGNTTAVKKLSVKTSESTIPGDFEMFPSTCAPGDIKTIYLTYTPAEVLDQGTITFELPDGFTADTEDRVCLSSGGNYMELTSDQITNEGKTVKLKNLDMEYYPSFGFDTVELNLYENIIPPEGTYTFCATEDADGDLPVKGPSGGTGDEAEVFTSENAPIDDLRAVADDGTVTLHFSKPAGATSVVLEQSFDDIAYTSPAGVSLDADSNTATLTGLENGTIYYFRLDVTGGVHDGVSNTVMTSPTRMDASESTVSIDTPLDAGSTSTLTVTIKDSSGLPITTQDAYLFTIYTDSTASFKINDVEYTGFSHYKILLTAPADENGTTYNTVWLHEDIDYFNIVISDVNDDAIDDYVYYP